ncbi:MerR family DNA-binding transcriptional regulator [Hyphomicrobium sp. 99]|uniref:MerR family transcriptional regulator n=1 Tax=Hyphomicrobium sp. 99 TaxID=1163419 RepID=UPI0005F8217E|nr:MerR family DNA-binding transcriptional regulator [Hyphomicrobium sp. 99]
MTAKSTGSSPRASGPDPDALPEPTFTISALAKEFGITTRAIRFYESRGLISPERIGTTRRYSKRDRARLILILRGRNLGFTVEDVSGYLALYDSDPGQLTQTRHLLEKVTVAVSDLETKRHDIERSIADLNDIRARCEEHLKKNA